jgi:hypothetical protein
MADHCSFEDLQTTPRQTKDCWPEKEACPGYETLKMTGKAVG